MEKMLTINLCNRNTGERFSRIKRPPKRSIISRFLRPPPHPLPLQLPSPQLQQQLLHPQHGWQQVLVHLKRSFFQNL